LVLKYALTEDGLRNIRFSRDGPVWT